jgi:hypothetical protein
LLDNLPSLKPIRDGDQEAPRFSQIGRSDDIRRGGVALDRFDAASSIRATGVLPHLLSRTHLAGL